MTGREAAERRRLLVHVAVSNPASTAELAHWLGRSEEAVLCDVDALVEAGALRVHDAVPRTVDTGSALAQAAPQELQEIQDRVLNELEGDTASVRPGVLRSLAESGCRDPRLLSLLLRAVNEAPGGSVLHTSLADVGRALGHDDEALLLLRAEVAASCGHSDVVLSITDDLLGTSSTRSVTRRAALLAASVHAQCDRLERAGALYRHVGPDHIGDAGAWAVMTSIGLGDVSGARAWREAMGTDDPTNYAAGLADLADGLLLSVEGSGEESLDLLARSASALAPSGAAALMPDTPAALASIVAISRGEPAAADVVLDRALHAGLGGEPGRRRHLLLSAWTLMVRGHLDEAESRIESVGSEADLSERDTLLLMGLRAGIARRRSDLPATSAAWREIRGHILGLRVDLFDLLPLSEMVVVAARLGDGERVRPMLRSAMELLDRLGHPPTWTATLHWSGVQAAFLAQSPAALVPHAEALVKAADVSTYAAALAKAGQTWLQILRNEADMDSVEEAVTALAEVGHVWDASRLAGQAAARGRDREASLSLMHLARRVEAGDSRRRVREAADSSVLTDRELDVARLVLAGHGYRAIGERLFISPKTVEHHVARMRRRLGASSRGELLTMLREVVEQIDTGS
ncbi:LuxR C-terminal-related transcriptional regulator [Aeromicrobium sp. CF4.19]|uniref:LuxR C-terminal-related transcriptional regulator n=1 Tax=Aeromicrobium sp. CF4.19 TaxID=3373082 RepID=UPI003EE43A05